MLNTCYTKRIIGGVWVTQGKANILERRGKRFSVIAAARTSRGDGHKSVSYYEA